MYIHGCNSLLHFNSWTRTIPFTEVIYGSLYRHLNILRCGLYIHYIIGDGWLIQGTNLRSKIQLCQDDRLSLTCTYNTASLARNMPIVATLVCSFARSFARLGLMPIVQPISISSNLKSIKLDSDSKDRILLSVLVISSRP